MSEFEMKSSESDLSDSDNELQEAFAKGLIKPGLNQVILKENKKIINNVADIKLRINEMRLKLPWLETMDVVSNPAPMAPDVALQLQDSTQRQINIRANNAKLPSIDISEDPVLNEFKRETLIHRQAQATVIEGIQRLKDLGIVTKRPDTYFAEMAKTDVHMQKVRQNLMAKQAGQARAEKVRQLRQQKKMGKQLQAQTKQQRAVEKKDMLNQVKKYRKGLKDQDDFMGDKKSNKHNNSTKSAAKRNMKDNKYGFGGKKRGNKLNTRDSSADFGDYNKSNKGKGKNISKNKGSMKQNNKRLGKSRRQNTKSKGRK